MKNQLVWLTALLLTGFIGISSSHAQDVVNMLPNGGFESGAVAPYHFRNTWIVLHCYMYVDSNYFQIENHKNSKIIF